MYCNSMVIRSGHRSLHLSKVLLEQRDKKFILTEYLAISVRQHFDISQSVLFLSTLPPAIPKILIGYWDEEKFDGCYNTISDQTDH